jgi:hypothetical protein
VSGFLNSALLLFLGDLEVVAEATVDTEKIKNSKGPEYKKIFAYLDLKQS